MSKKHDNAVKIGFKVAWPALLVVLTILVLQAFVGSGRIVDIETWPSIKSILANCGNAPHCADFLTVSRDNTIVSFGAALFLFFNALSFIFTVQRISQAMSREGTDSDTTRDMGLICRTFALVPSIIWGVKIVAIPENFDGVYFDDYLVLATFALCAIADASIVAVLWKQKDGDLWLDNREILGALCYIDIPTLIGISIIVWYGHLFQAEWVNHADQAGHEPILKAMSGGALIIHVVTSQVILCFLIAQAKFNKSLERHWLGRRSAVKAN